MAFPGPHKVVQLPRGNLATVGAYVGSIGQLVADTENNEIYLMDGTTPGGHRIPNMANILAEVPGGGGGGGGSLPEGSNALALAGTDPTQRSWPATAYSQFAPKANPVFTGTTAAPTPITSDKTTKIATTEFVRNYLQSVEGSNSLAAAGTDTVQRLWPATAFSQYVGAASPAFSGTPTAPTPPTSDNSTRIATSAYVMATIAANSKPMPSNVTDFALVNYPIGTIILANNGSAGGQNITSTTTIRLDASNPSKGYQVGGTGAVLAGTWRCRGNIEPTSNAAAYSLWERVA